MQTSKCANLADILMSEWRSALISTKLVVHRGDYHGNIVWLDLQISFQTVAAVINMRGY
jgi:hypothetical protein